MQTTIEECGPEPDPQLAQWYTPPWLGHTSVEWW